MHKHKGNSVPEQFYGSFDVTLGAINISEPFKSPRPTSNTEPLAAAQTLLAVYVYDCRRLSEALSNVAD